MIKSDQFYAAFSKGLAQVCPIEAQLRRRGRIPKCVANTPVGKVDIWFKVNGKASALPFQPGEFWPVLEVADLRFNDRDDGTLSWYQYADESNQEEMLNQQKVVMRKVAGQNNIEPRLWEVSRDVSVRSMADFIEMGFRVGFPHTSLYYLDEEDAFVWGGILGKQLPDWLERFCAAPETLEGYMWRVHWAAETRA